MSEHLCQSVEGSELYATTVTRRETNQDAENAKPIDRSSGARHDEPDFLHRVQPRAPPVDAGMRAESSQIVLNLPAIA
jgi:hypothetical protein